MSGIPTTGITFLSHKLNNTIKNNIKLSVLDTIIFKFNDIIIN